jgi:phasin
VESELRGLNFIGAAKKATDAAETLPFGAKDAVAKAMSFAENNVNAAFDLAQKLVRAKDVSEVLALQSEFAKSQMVAMQTQAKELGAVAQDAINSAYPKVIHAIFAGHRIPPAAGSSTCSAKTGLQRRHRSPQFIVECRSARRAAHRVKA